MAYKLVNDGFDRRYNNPILNESKSTAAELRRALELTRDRLFNQHIANIKAYEVAYQDIIEKLFPDKPWWEVTDCDIFQSLFNDRDPNKTIACIIAGLKPEATRKEKSAIEESYVIDTWGQVDEDPYEVAKAYNLTVRVVDRNRDETTYKFVGKKEDIERAKADGYFYSDEAQLKEGYVKNCDGQTFCSIDGDHWKECSQEEYQEYLDGGYEEVTCENVEKRSRLHEAYWRYTLKNGPALRQAIEDEEPDAVVTELRKCYDELHNQGFIDDRDYESWVEEGLDFLDPDDDDYYDSIDFELDQFYDLCDNIRVAIPLA